MALRSQLFRGDPKLEAAAVSDPAHIIPGARGPHVGKIQAALMAVDGANLPQDSSYGPNTAEAVRRFKQKRNILNFQGSIDNIVGKKTIAALDAEMFSVEGGRSGSGVGSTGFGSGDDGGGTSHLQINFAFTVAPTIVDFVIRFRAGSFRRVLENIDLTNYRLKTNRELESIDGGAEVGNPSIINSVISKINARLQDSTVQQGAILVYGNSGGGRNVLEFAAALRGKRPIKFIGIADAALFGDLPGMNKPIPNPADIIFRKAINKPRWLTPPASDAEIKHNYFQNVDNRVGGINPFAAVWTSENPNSEIHGELEGFQINEQISIPFGQRFQAHDIAGDEGDRRNQAKITSLLSAL